jgi:hypothetical protein
MAVAVRLATNYEKISRRGTATILLSKNISCIAIDKLLVGMEFPFFSLVKFNSEATNIHILIVLTK